LSIIDKDKSFCTINPNILSFFCIGRK